MAQSGFVEPQGIKLNLGCGGMRIPGTKGVDQVNIGATDVIADLDAPFLPFAPEV